MPDPVYRIHPLHDSRWDEFVQSHPEASVFHQRAWLQSLSQVYGYEPIVFTTAPPGVLLSNGIVCCSVRSMLTGSRLVSLSFADHCQPLVSDSADLTSLLASIEEYVHSESLRFFELRCLSSHWPVLDDNRSVSFTYHVLDLRPDLDTLFRQFHHSCVQRKIRRAERERLIYEEGNSDASIRKFYDLFVMTRRRHGLPPQPLKWFVSLRNAWGEALKVGIILRDAKPIASIMTIRHKQRLVYKYGCSDSRFHNLGVVPLLFWKAIQQGKGLGAVELDLGRSDLDDQGLITFKDRLGAKCSILNYYRYPQQAASDAKLLGKNFSSALYSYLPSSWLRVAGKLLYRHVG